MQKPEVCRVDNETPTLRNVVPRAPEATTTAGLMKKRRMTRNKRDAKQAKDMKGSKVKL